MPIRIFNNIPSLNAQRLLGINTDRLAKSVERIASGIRVNRGADDAAGLAISEALRSDIRALRQAVRNANDGIALINVAEGALNEQAGILIRLRELSSQAATGTVGSTERATINLEFQALIKEIDRIADTTEFNGQLLVEGSLASSVASASQILIQVGIDASSQSRINLNTEINLTSIKSDVLTAKVVDSRIAAVTLGGTAGTSGTVSFTSIRLDQLDVLNADNALVALESINSFIADVTSGRGKIGAVQNRLVRSIGNLSVSVENLTAAESAIRDADIAEEVANLTRNQILVQAATAMVAQANLIPQSALQLLA